MNMHNPDHTCTGYVLVNINTKRPLYFTGVFDGNGRNMSHFLEDAYVFMNATNAEDYQTLNTLVDDLKIRSLETNRTGFGERATAYADNILLSVNQCLPWGKPS